MRDSGSRAARGGSLTEQQLAGHAVGAADLATAYPVVPLPTDLIELVTHCTRDVLAADATGLCTPAIGSNTERTVVDAASALLGIPSGAPRLRSTMTGAIAIDRAFRGVEIMAQERRSSTIRVITTEPSVDVARQVLGERIAISVETVRLGPASAESDIGELLSKINDSQVRTRARTTTVVFLTSPENPTGRVWSEPELAMIATALGMTQGVLIVDHCLLVAGVHHPQIPSAIWNLGSLPCDWVGIWDTGKTIDLRGGKIAMIATSGVDLAAAVDRALEVVQFGPSRCSAAVFSRLLRHPSLEQYLSDLGHLCRRNLAILRAQLPDGFDAPNPTAGTVAWIDVGRSGQTGDMWRRRWLAQGVATVAGDAFFAGPPFPGTHVRVALARPEDSFASAMERVGCRHDDREHGRALASAGCARTLSATHDR
jgi:bifunctional pyridoxal-dependent enzyme with beta-cystathionase and maltose regulon repressor activities